MDPAEPHHLGTQVSGYTDARDNPPHLFLQCPLHDARLICVLQNVNTISKIICKEGNMKEQWKDIAGYEGLYEVSSLGRIKSLPRTIHCQRLGKAITRRKPETILGQKSTRRRFYPIVVLRNKRGVLKWFTVHSLVLETFIGPRPKGMECCHFPDRDPWNNCLDNIHWGTPSENQMHRVLHGSSNRGEAHGMSKLTERIVRRIRLLHNQGLNNAAIGRRLNLSSELVGKIIRGDRWGWLKT